jgi:predicted transposase YdaD
VLVVLRPKANATDQTGWLELEGADDSPYLTFRYTVVRVWEESIAGLLVAGPGLAPLAVLTNEAAADLDSAFERFRDRLQQPDVPRNVAEVLFGATFLLSGLRYDRDRIINLYRRLSMTLEDSTTYQWIMEQGEARGEARGLAMGEAHGRLAEARNIVSLLGSHRFGQPSAAIQEALEAITDRDRLERIAKRIIDAGGWDDLLATP